MKRIRKYELVYNHMPKKELDNSILKERIKMFKKRGHPLVLGSK